MTTFPLAAAVSAAAAPDNAIPSRPGRSAALILGPNQRDLKSGHDYCHGGREARFESTVGEQRRANTHFASAPTCEEFVAVREARDRSLPMPRLILHALQVNIRAGRLPGADAEGRRFLRFPLDALEGAAWA